MQFSTPIMSHELTIQHVKCTNKSVNISQAIRRNFIVGHVQHKANNYKTTILRMLSAYTQITLRFKTVLSESTIVTTTIHGHFIGKQFRP